MQLAPVIPVAVSFDVKYQGPGAPGGADMTARYRLDLDLHEQGEGPQATRVRLDGEFDDQPTVRVAGAAEITDAERAAAAGVAQALAGSSLLQEKVPYDDAIEVATGTARLAWTDSEGQQFMVERPAEAGNPSFGVEVDAAIAAYGEAAGLRSIITGEAARVPIADADLAPVTLDAGAIVTELEPIPLD